MINKNFPLALKTALLLLVFSFLLGQSATPGASSVTTTIEDFSFTKTDDSIVSLYAFSGKPVILEWGASWCSVCKENQETMDELYALYSDSVHFISLSYGGSGDSLSDVARMKNDGSYPWTFGLDHTNVASTHQVRNGHLWILDSSFNLVKEWGKSIVQASAIQDELNPLLSPEEQQPTIQDDDSLLPFDNIFFVGFVIVAVLGIAGIAFLRIYSRLQKSSKID
ncbi:MAG: TlpA family protein disulfide reductase [Candidatus Hodarchaeales archaeon]|jgi:thiol-disulfide isomerase/thioredoxin